MKELSKANAALAKLPALDRRMAIISLVAKHCVDGEDPLAEAAVISQGVQLTVAAGLEGAGRVES